MRTEMHYVSVHDLHVISEREVVIIIDLSTHVNLHDPSVVQRSMNTMLARYVALQHWEAEAKDGWLYIKVIGDINQEELARWRDKNG